MPKITPIKRPQVPINGYKELVRNPLKDMPIELAEAETPLLAEESEVGLAIAADAEISIPLLVAGIILIGLLYSAKYFLVPLLKLIKIPGSNWFSEVINKAIGFITSPIKDFLKAVMARIADGIEAHARPITAFMEASAWIIHDFAIEAANFATTATADIALIVVRVIPQEIAKATKPLKLRIGRIEFFDNELNTIARGYRFKNFPAMVRAQEPDAIQVRKAIRYVESQKHKSLAGALSVYQTTTNQVKAMQTTVRHYRYYEMPNWIRHVETEVTRTLPQRIHKVELRVGKVEAKIKPNRFGVPELMAIMSPAAIASWFRPAIPQVCTQVGDCAAENLVGKNNWNIFKDLLKLLLAATVDALLLGDLCTIAKGAIALAGVVEGPLRELVTVEGGLISAGCAGEAQTLPPPLY